MTSPPAGGRAPLAAGLLCYTFWGLLPILFQAAGRAGATPWEIVAWRIVWAVPCAALLVWASRQGPKFWQLAARPADLAVLVLSAALISLNWLVYVWAVSTHRTLEASLGYYINPLLNMAAGALMFRERISRSGWIAIALATAGVVLQAVALGAPPWVSIVLALSFCSYGVVRKQAAADAQTGLMVECLVVFIPAAAYAAWLAHKGVGHFGASPTVTWLLLLGGPATVVPLAAFAWAARRLTLTVMGFLQFIAPTLQFIVGVENGEHLTPLRVASFGFIWAGVMVFAAGAWLRTRRLQPSAA